MQNNYYVILGLSAQASADEIKTAFRRRAQEVHPDRSGLESGPFLEVQEAYGVLSDPARRRDYDRQITPVARRRPWGPSVEPLVRPRPRGEPFADGRGRPEVSLADSFATHQPSFDELFTRLLSNFDSLSRPKAEHLESLTVEVVLTPEEAAPGGVVRVGIPARATCPACGGRGAVGADACWRCEGFGAVVRDYPLDLSYPPGLRDAHAARIRLDSLGIENFYLTVLFRMGGDSSRQRWEPGASATGHED